MKNIVVAMSGGVDSSAAAALLHEQGHRVIGVTLRLLRQETGFGCCGSTRDIDDARAVCHRLGVPHYVLDFSENFRDNIITPFLETYLRGETPNPCVACNRFVKFDALLKKAEALGADAVATGHYARVVFDGKIHRLLRAADRNKDQSYVLHNLGRKELSRLMFPVGELNKSTVRDIARRHELKTAEKEESMEICFVPDADTPAYVKSRAGNAATARPGPIRDTDGKELGSHEGVAFYTRGQRRGLKLSVGKPMYVVNLDAETNTVVVGPDEKTLSEKFIVEGVHWTRGEAPSENFKALVQIRSRHAAAPCRVSLNGNRAEVRLDIPQRAVTPGQSAVFYDGDEVLGGGAIGGPVP